MRIDILSAPDHGKAVEMVESGEVEAFVMDDVLLYGLAANYDKWFLKPIPPKNTALNMPVSYLLKDFWKYPTDIVPF